MIRKIFLISMCSLFIFCSIGNAELIDNGDGTVTDTKTGLIWQQAESGTMPWKEALTYCETLGLAGHSDWRMPTIVELQSLFDSIFENSSANKKKFPGISYAYWSSNPNPDKSGDAMTVSFMAGDGGTYSADVKNAQDVRAVRGGNNYAQKNAAAGVDEIKAKLFRPEG